MADTDNSNKPAKAAENLTPPSLGEGSVAKDSVSEARADTVPSQNRHDPYAKSIAWATWTMAIVTAFTMGVLILHGYELHRATDAAETSAKAALNADRPNMLVSQLKVWGLKQAPNEQRDIGLSSTFNFTNYGSAPAKIKKWCVELDPGDLPAQPRYRNCNTTLRVIPPSGWYGSAIPFKKGIDLTTAQKILDEKVGLFFFGTIEYTDAIDTPHVSRFCYQSDMAGADASVRFYPACPAEYWEYN